MKLKDVFNLSDKTYDRMVWFVEIALPALATCYAALAGFWGFPAGEQVVGSLAAVILLLGTVLGVSRRNYEPETSGVLVVDEHDPEKDTFSFVVENENMFDVNDGEILNFRVNKL